MAAIAAVVLAFLVRVVGGNRAIAPYDDLYHWKRILYSAAHFPRVLEFDPDRGLGGAFCPWPPVYDLLAGGIVRLFGADVIIWIPPVVTSLLIGVTVFVAGWRAIPIAYAPFLVVASSVADIDHHFLEPFLVLAIVAATMQRSWIALTLALVAALFVQTGLILAAGLSFACLFFLADKATRRRGAIAFVVAAGVVLLYRVTRLPGYPDGPWFLGTTHAALLIAAAIALVWRPAIIVSAGIVTPFVLDGMRFFAGDPWLSTIQEFQPIWKRNIANYAAALWSAGVLTRVSVLNIFTFAYVAATISTSRFATISTVLVIVAAAQIRNRVITALLFVIPAAQLIAWRVGGPAPVPHVPDFHFEKPGRVLAPWSWGHAIDVLEGRAVVIDNFGSMPDPELFRRAHSLLMGGDERSLAAFCDRHAIRYVVLRPPRKLTAFRRVGGDETFDVYTRDIGDASVGKNGRRIGDP